MNFGNSWQTLMSMEEELDRYFKLYFSAKEKLENINFLNKAPVEIIEKEKCKLKDSLDIITILENRSLNLLKSI